MRGLAHLFAVKLEDEAQNAVGRGVDRAEVDDDALGGDGLDLVQDVVPVAALGEDLGISSRADRSRRRDAWKAVVISSHSYERRRKR